VEGLNQEIEIIIKETGEKEEQLIVSNLNILKSTLHELFNYLKIRHFVFHVYLDFFLLIEKVKILSLLKDLDLASD
jgi:hypothetical protein